jgi:hypothetical protein
VPMIPIFTILCVVDNVERGPCVWLNVRHWIWQEVNHRRTHFLLHSTFNSCSFTFRLDHISQRVRTITPRCSIYYFSSFVLLRVVVECWIISNSDTLNRKHFSFFTTHIQSNAVVMKNSKLIVHN